MKKIIRIFSRLIFISLLVILIWATFNFSLVIYGINQLRGQLHIVLNSRPLQEILIDKSVPDSVKEKIHFIETVKKFAVDSIGLNPSENYSTFYDQQNKPLLWVLTASEPFKIKAYEWKFPLLGNVSYKGFFDFEKGKEEEENLKASGYDTDYGEVSAWSTLGWFHDPILSGILRRSKGQLAELIIHELTHATLYIKSNVNLNENLASVCGEIGSIRFLQSTYGHDSNELKQFIEQKKDYDQFSKHMLIGAHMLDSLYSAMKDSIFLLKKLSKARMINRIVNSLDTVSFYSHKNYKNIFKNALPNNAYFIDFIRYDAQKDEMKNKLIENFNGNIKAYINYLRLKQDSL